MTVENMATPEFPVTTAPYEEPEQQPRRRTLAQQTLIDTFSRNGARLGGIWLCIVLFLGIFAPLLANSHPILLKLTGAGWSSPLLRFLTPTDVILLILTFAGLVLYATRRLAVPQIAAALIWLLAILTPVITWPTWPYPKIAIQTIVEISRLIPMALLGITAGLIVFAMLRPHRWLWVFGLIVLFHGLYIWRYGATSYGRFWEQLLAVALLAALLLNAAVIVAVPLISSASRGMKIGIGLFALLVIVATIVHPIHPPVVDLPSRYREDQAAGLVQRSITTLIPYSPNDRLRDFSAPQQNLPPSRAHWFGTTPNGEDVLSRMIYACRIAISIGFVSTGIAVVIGCVVGGLMGYYVGKVDILGMRLIEVFEAIPTLFLLITFVAFYGRNLYIMMAIIGLTSWTADARFIRAEFLRLRTQDFVQAATAAGLRLRSILFKHMLPNGIAPVLVTASFGVASAILAEATLSFLGLGLIDEPSWGQMLNQARGVGTDFLWWMAIFPGGAIFLTVFAYNLIGEALRDALDPKFRKRD